MKCNERKLIGNENTEVSNIQKVHRKPNVDPNV